VTVKTKKKDGITCKCGHFESYGAYIYAHAKIPMVFICPKCKTKTSFVYKALPPGKGEKE
jgi:hypothetical protein